jgi:hypothetical protein
MNGKMFIAALLILAILIPPAAIAQLKYTRAQTSDTIVVPDDYPTINDAIGNATSGDTILVRNGTYTEQTIEINEPLTITSEYLNGVTINLHPPQYEVGLFTGVEWLYNNSITIQASNVNLFGLEINGGGGDIQANGNQNQIINDTIQSALSLAGSNQTVKDNTVLILSVARSLK